MSPGAFKLLFLGLMGTGIPVAITLGGGYGLDIQDTVEAHCNTVRAARAVFGRLPPASHK